MATDIFKPTDVPGVRSADLMATYLRSPQLLADIQLDPSKIDDIKEKVIQETDQANQSLTRSRALEDDRWVYRLTTIVLGSVTIVCLIGIIALSYAKGNSNVPDALVSLAATSIGALAGLLSPITARK